MVLAATRCLVVQVLDSRSRLQGFRVFSFGFVSVFFSFLLLLVCPKPSSLLKGF